MLMAGGPPKQSSSPIMVRTRRLPAAGLAAVALLMASCNSGSPKVGSELCAHMSEIVNLSVTRIELFPQNHLTFSFPAMVDVRKSASAKTVADVLCQLPPMPSGAVNCPADLGVSYKLTFRLRKGAGDTVVVEPAGCQTVRGLGPQRWLRGSGILWTDLGLAMGLAHASDATFRGAGA